MSRTDGKALDKWFARPPARSFVLAWKASLRQSPIDGAGVSAEVPDGPLEGGLIAMTLPRRGELGGGLG